MVTTLNFWGHPHLNLLKRKFKGATFERNQSKIIQLQRANTLTFTAEPTKSGAFIEEGIFFPPRGFKIQVKRINNKMAPDFVPWSHNNLTFLV